MKQILRLTLAIMIALGGFVDLGQIVFAMQAGALFGFALLWTMLLGAIAIMIYSEMCGRVADVTKDAVFSVVRTRLGDRLGLITLGGANLLNLLTCAAELGAIGIVLHLLTGWNERFVILTGALALGALVWFVRLPWIERTFGLWGLLLVVFAVAAWKLHPDWGALAGGVIPRGPAPGGAHQTLLYGYFAVGIFSAMLMAYVVHVYSSSAIEQQRDENVLSRDTTVAISGTALGSLIMVALLVLGGIVFLPGGIFPDMLSTAFLPVALPLGRTALIIALLGVLAAVASAAVETALCTGYNTCQFFGFRWNKSLPPAEVPQFTIAWVATLVLATVIALSGVPPLKLVEYAVVLGMVLMPLTYYPILMAAGDRARMGEHASKRWLHVVGWVFLALIGIAALLAIPLMILTHVGQP